MNSDKLRAVEAEAILRVVVNSIRVTFGCDCARTTAYFWDANETPSDAQQSIAPTASVLK
jgi:hypothetical protein